MWIESCVRHIVVDDVWQVWRRRVSRKYFVNGKIFRKTFKIILCFDIPTNMIRKFFFSFREEFNEVLS
jgi:hypothetical protein